MSLGYLATSQLNILHHKKEENAGLCIADEKCFGILLKGFNSGHTSDTAIDKVYSVYGRNLEVTHILKKLALDRKKGGHPELQ